MNLPHYNGRIDILYGVIIKLKSIVYRYIKGQ